MKKNIALVMGGYSGEFEVSINSGKQVYESIDKSRYNVYKIVIEREEWYWEEEGERREVDRGDFTIEVSGGKIRFDLAFIIVHGTPGENGILQGYFDMLGIRYTTCDFYCSALTFNKSYCNAVVRDMGIVNVAFSRTLYREKPYDKDQIAKELGLPVFVKPASGGSSVATTKVKRWEDFEAAVREAFAVDEAVLVEQYIKGREFDCGVFGTKEQKYIFPITEIIPTGEHEFFDYAAKYEGFSNEVTPAEVDGRIAEMIQRTSSELYDRLHCRGIVRFDYIYDEDREKLYFLEVNTIPGQSAESIVPKQARAIGISPARLYEMVIEEFLE